MEWFVLDEGLIVSLSIFIIMAVSDCLFNKEIAFKTFFHNISFQYLFLMKCEHRILTSIALLLDIRCALAEYCLSINGYLFFRNLSL